MLLPGQIEEHCISCFFSPPHELPPFKGAGFVQERCLLWYPLPHLAEQSDHRLHDDQPPLTVKEKKHSLFFCITCINFYQQNKQQYLYRNRR